MIRLRFLGAAGTVTGSRYLIEHQGHRFLLDCGLFQGGKELRLRNWDAFPVPPASVEAIVMTHAHIDHSGYLPRLAKGGFRGPVHCTAGTKDLCGLLLPDSGHLQEEEAEWANRHGSSRHKPALPLYTRADAEACLGLLQAHRYHEPVQVVPGVTARFYDAGHILGSARVELEIGGRRLVFSGDVGRADAPILQDPEPLTEADWLVLEATYGDRAHGQHPIEENLQRIVTETVERGGVVVIPAFATERAQEIVYLLDQLHRSHGIPAVPLYIDSPMAVRAVRLFQQHPEYYDDEARKLLEAGRRVLGYPGLRMTESTEESKAINRAQPPFIVISASGMATGGRILHHLKFRLPDPRNTILLVGYQPEGTRGWRLLKGEREIKVFGEWVPVRARVEKLDGFSGHADYVQINRWIQGLQAPPKRTFLTHGEAASLEAQRERIAAMGWDVHVPQHLEEVVLE